MKDEIYEFLKNEVGKVQIVGFGSYGEVKLAKNTQNGDIVAIKLIYNKNAKEEIDVHHKLNHPSIIKLINYYYQKDKNTTYMVLEYASGGTLNEKIKFGYGQLSKQLIKRYFRDICLAVDYLHQNNYMHRDIKPQNILITKDNHAKLCDFGFASILEYRSTICGTFQYMAPEMIKKNPYDYRIDIWALGILLFELIQGFAPFRGQTGQQVITQMKKSLSFSNRFTALQIDLIKKILRVNPENRIETSKILQHPYFTEDGEQLKDEEPKTPVSTEVKQQQKKVPSEGLAIKKEGKFDFLQKKRQTKKEEDSRTDLPVQIQAKIQFPKKEDFSDKKEEQNKKKQSKKQFKPFVPASFKPGFKSPNMKPGNPMIPTSPTSFQVNNSMQNPSTQQTNLFGSSPLTPTGVVYNQNVSMTAMPRQYISPSTPGTVVYQQPSFTSFTSQTAQNFEPRSPGSQLPTYPAYPGWKKT